MGERPRLLLVDDEYPIRNAIYQVIKEDYEVVTCEDADQALQELSDKEFEIMLLDLHLPPDTSTPDHGLRVLETALKRYPDIKVVAMTGFGDKQLGPQVMASGAFDYLQKPFDMTELEIIIKRAKRIQELEIENKRLQYQLKDYQWGELIGDSPQMKGIYATIEHVAKTDAVVLLQGESGTGKELIAREIHKRSNRKNEIFMALNCAAIPDTLLESELFGYEKGAFTGATKKSLGKIKAADGGTLFLDEISELTPQAQSKLLRVLETQTYLPIGSETPVTVNIRIIAATNSDLKQLVEQKKFREDLYYRLNVITLHVPPLRARGGDVKILANYFLKKFTEEMKKNIKGFSPAVMKLFEEYNWPGNVRELRNVVERAVILTNTPYIQPEVLPPELYRTEPKKRAAVEDTFHNQLQVYKRMIIKEALELKNGNRTLTAQMLGLSRAHLFRLMKELGVEVPKKKKAELRALEKGKK